MATKRRRRPARPAAAPVTVAVDEPASPPDKRPVKPRARPQVTAADVRDIPWTVTGLLGLLGLAFVVQIPVGILINVTSHTNPLIIDVFFFQPQYLVIACVLVMPLARRLTGQPRNLRLLESLSLGVMYALLSLMLGTVFVHPATAAQSTDQFIRNLKLSDGLLIALSDVIALFGTVTLYPGFSRLLGAPARRARARMLERNSPAGTAGKPAARPASARAATARVKAKPKR